MFTDRERDGTDKAVEEDDELFLSRSISCFEEEEEDDDDDESVLSRSILGFEEEEEDDAVNMSSIYFFSSCDNSNKSMRFVERVLRSYIHKILIIEVTLIQTKLKAKVQTKQDQ